MLPFSSIRHGQFGQVFLLSHYLLSDTEALATLPAVQPFHRPNQPLYQKDPRKMLPHSSPVQGPVCSDFVTDGCVLGYLASKNLSSALDFPSRPNSGPNHSELLLELLLLLVSGSSFSERVLVRLAAAEQAEPDVWLRDDLRIAWLAVLYSANNRPTPWDWAFNRVIGGHPSKVIPQLVARLDKHAAMGLPPKKSAASTASTASGNLAKAAVGGFPHE